MVSAGEEIRAVDVTNAPSYNMSLFVKILHDVYHPNRWRTPWEASQDQVEHEFG
jgi:hypothetical protein|tara:strand:- start:26 stop:187 length:162 start_codon:yes stop_codon:yes gene_type:complete